MITVVVVVVVIIVVVVVIITITITTITIIMIIVVVIIMTTMVQRYFPKAYHLSSGLVLESSYGYSVAFSNWSFIVRGDRTALGAAPIHHELTIN